MKIIEKQLLATHNQQVLGSSPSWATLVIKHLQYICKCFFVLWRTIDEHLVFRLVYFYYYFSLFL